MTSASVPASEAPPLRDAHERRIPAPVFWELVAHLARRQLDTRHQLTLLGWAWPLTRQLAQLAVLVFIFSAVFDLGIDDFPVFAFIGLIAWTWFATGVGDGAWSITGQRHMILLSRLPKAALPLVAVVVPLVDVEVGPRSQCGDERLECLRRIPVVGVEEGKEVSARMLDGRVACSRYAALRSANDADSKISRRSSLRDQGGVIARAVVDG